MHDIISLEDLQETIRQLEARRELEHTELKYQFEEAYESIKPANLIKNTLKEVATSVELRGSVVHAAVGLAAGMLTRTLFVGFSGGPVRKLVGTLLMHGMTNLVSRKAEIITAAGKKLLQFINRKKNNSAIKELPAGIDLPYE